MNRTIAARERERKNVPPISKCTLGGQPEIQVPDKEYCVNFKEGTKIPKKIAGAIKMQ